MNDIVVTLLAYVVAAGVLTVTPGVDSTLVLRTAASEGPRSAIAAGIGICLGCFIWGAGAAFGLTALLAVSELAFTVFKWVGAGYLAWLGLQLLLRPRSELSTSPYSAAHASFRRGLLTNLLNPKIGVFYLTFLPQFIPSGVNTAAFALALAAIHVVLTIGWFALLIALAAPLGQWLATPRIVRGLDRLTGCVFLAFGLRLALAETK